MTTALGLRAAAFGLIALAACAGAPAGCIGSVLHLNATTLYLPVNSTVRHPCGLAVEEPAAQSLPLAPSALSAALLGYVAGRHRHKPLALILVMAVGYLYTDWYLNVLHMYLDIPQNLEHPVPLIRSLASDFQSHHRFPGLIISENHVATIVPVIYLMYLCLACWAAAAAAKGLRLPDALFAFVAAVLVSGTLGGYNHQKMHCRTHGYDIGWLRHLQDLGLLPHPDFHRAHHTVPHSEKWSFLVGLGAVYEKLFALAGRGAAAEALWWVSQPAVALSLAAGVWMWLGASGSGSEDAKHKKMA